MGNSFGVEETTKVNWILGCKKFRWFDDDIIDERDL